ncbi:hypothetical protein ACFL6S_19075 [Candidatus Poribacteria bacterium]
MTDQVEYEPTSNYEMQNIEGWTVYVNRRLLDEEKELGHDFLRLMRVKLYDINRLFPSSALKRLYDVAIWLEANNEKVTCACYHPSEQWLREHGFNPEKAKSVEIGNAANFIQWSLHQPMMVLHELAHGYHHQVLGYDNPDIKVAYKQAVEARIYESVLRYDGEQAQAYALNNDQEYFAEQTEAYFGTNDFYPFVKAELMKHDPLMYETLRKLWGE